MLLDSGKVAEGFTVYPATLSFRLAWTARANTNLDVLIREGSAQLSVRIGFIGTGGIATPHLINLQRIDDADVVGLCDVSIDRCEAAARRVNGALNALSRPGGPPVSELSAEMFTSAADMIASVNPDAVYIAVPPFVHGDLERTVIDAGKHIFVEKPVALTMDLARDIESRILDAGIISAVGYQSRSSDAVLKAKQALEGREIGLLQGTYYGSLPQVAWWRVQEQSGGQVVEQATHTVDLMRFLGGDVSTVYAAGATRILTEVENLDVYDVNAVTLTFESGAVGALLTTCALDGWSGPNWFHGVTVFASGLSLSAWLDQVTIRTSESEEVVGAQTDAMFETDKSFVAAVMSGDGSMVGSDYSNGVRTLEVTLAAVESARSGQPVEL